MPLPFFKLPLDVPNYPADRYAPLADRLRKMLATESDLLFIQAEALLALEASAISLARPGVTALNIVTSPYGAYFGAWLRRGGVSVTEITAAPGQAITLGAVEAALASRKSLDILALVHGEGANGALNPLAEIAERAQRCNALVVVDAVASFGAHPLDIDKLGIDLAVIGPQKALAGPAGLSAITVSERAWMHIAKTTDFAPSSLSLAEIKANWLDRGRGALPGTPSALEFWALEAAVDRVEVEGLENLIARHAQAARASRAGLRGLGIAPWIADDASASHLVTSAPVPPGLDADRIIAEAATAGVALGRGFGDIEGKLVRLDHTGPRASFTSVVASVTAYGKAVTKLAAKADVGAGAAAVASAYFDTAG
jgi:aspartate aminotransferase-like enzyme